MDSCRNVNFSADQNSTFPKVQGLISRVRLLKMFPLFEDLSIATKRVCLQNIELKYQKVSLFWKAKNRFSATSGHLLLKMLKNDTLSILRACVSAIWSFQA